LTPPIAEGSARKPRTNQPHAKSTTAPTSSNQVIQPGDGFREI
jgi:hypothetical protein